MDAGRARERFAAARVAIFASVRPDGTPHLVPVTFAVTGPDTVAWAVDHKPKRSTRLQRLENIAHRPDVSLLVHRYDEDWTRLWWVRADGRAAIHDGDDRDRRAAVAALTERYPEYRDHPPEGPVVTVAVERWSGWEA